MHRQITPNVSSYLNWVRWICALLVTIHHVRTHMFVDFPEIVEPGIWHKGFYFITLFGRAPVMVFFVVSGYLVGGALVGRSLTKAVIGRYLFDRVVRLHVVLLPAFAIIVILYAIAVTMRPELLLHATGKAYSVSVLIGNIAFLQTVVVPCYGNDFPLWSLANEFWYYAALPFTLLSFSSQTPVRVRVGAGFILLALGSLLPVSIVILYGHWLVGFAVHFVRRSVPNSLVSLVLLIGVSVGSRVFYPEGHWGYDLLVASTMALTICSFTQSSDSKFLTQTKPIADAMAGFSFSLYVLHMPVFVFLLALAGKPYGTRVAPDAAGILFYCGSVLVIYAVAWRFSKFTEDKTKNVKTWVLQRLGGGLSSEGGRGAQLAAPVNVGVPEV